MNEAWVVFYGHQLHMTTEETLNTRWGLFLDLMACAAIDSGGAEMKEAKKSREQIIFGMR